MKLVTKNRFLASGSNEDNISDLSKNQLSKSTTRSPIMNSTNVDNRSSCKNISVTKNNEGNRISTALPNPVNFDDIEVRTFFCNYSYICIQLYT